MAPAVLLRQGFGEFSGALQKISEGECEGEGKFGFRIWDFGFLKSGKRPERPGRELPGAEPRKTTQEMRSPEGAKEGIDVL